MNDLEITFKIIVLCGGGFLAIVFLAIAWRLIKTSPQKYKKMQQASPSFWEILFGVGKKIDNPAVKNYRQRLFPVINSKTGQWEVRAVCRDISS